ncbi:MAG: zinc ribbon domain-containing protein [Gammaproteobacteria bacterium]|nr:zinc ribbon domain-containing protein [Gammaproteobacteria bacterium]
MYSTCPKCGHQRGDGGAEDSCPACGIVYAKWLKNKLGSAAGVRTSAPARSSSEAGWWASVPGLLMQVEGRVNPLIFWGRVVVWVGLIYWGWRFIAMDFVENPWAIGNAWMHNVNLVFHEAGHILFRPLGWFMTILGGTLGQLIMPGVVMGVFLFRNRNPFGAAVGLWWLGQSFMDCAPYIDDALEQKLVLLGGHTGADAPGNHDWNNILGEFDVLERHRQYASLADGAGTLLVILALIWGGALLWRQFQRLE